MRAIKLLWLGFLAFACSSEQSADEMRPSAARTEREVQIAEPPAELVDQLANCERDLEAARATLSDQTAELERALADETSDELRQQLMAAELEQRELRRALEQAEGSLGEARRELESRDYEEALEELADVRASLERLARERAELPGGVELQVEFSLAGAPLLLDRAYESPLGTLRIARARYWLSNVVLIRPDGSTYEIPSSYYLMELSTAQPLRNGTQKPLTLPAKRREVVTFSNVPKGDYVAVSFDLGVDPAHNDDLSLPGGELGVLTNMAASQWMWFTSYIFTQLEAQIAPSDALSDDGGVAPDTLLLWENGTNDDLRRVELRLPTAIHVGIDLHPRLELALEVERLFAGLEGQIEAARAASPDYPTSLIGAFDANARTRLADNWRSAFRVRNVRHGVQ